MFCCHKDREISTCVACWRLSVCLTFNGSILQVQGSGSASDSGLSSPASPASSLDKHEASLKPQPLSEAKPRTPRPKSQFVPKPNSDSNLANRSVLLRSAMIAF